MTPDERLYLLLDRYLAGEASAGDAQAVRDWVAADPEHARLLEDLRLIKRVAAERVPESGTAAAWRRARRQLEAVRQPRRWRPPLGLALATAAAVVVLIGGMAVLHRAPPWRVYATTAAQRLVMRLGDGTQVTLAPQSRLRYTADYGTTHRDLYLDGAAYFQVTPDSQRPLRVHTAQSVTEDLGTAFVVRAYADQAATEVVVAEGRVALSRVATTVASHEPALVLGARDLGRLDPSGVATLRRSVDVDRELAWTRGVLAFDAAPLSDVVRTLGRWYNAEIRLADGDLAARPLTATFQNESIDQVLQRIALTVGLRVERTDGSVFLLRSAPSGRAQHASGLKE